jgi:hypothetical protein
MSLITQLTSPFRHAFSAVFRRHLSVRVAQGGVKVTLKDDPYLPAEQRLPSRAELAARKEQQEFALIQIQLAELLADLPETRATMRHLVFVEKALERKGLRALHKLPLDVLQRALEQLEGLVVNWSPVGLAALRSKMAVAIIDREHQGSAAEAEADAYRTAAVLDTMPMEEFRAGVEVRTDDDALTAAYAALGNLAPGAVELQGELGSSAGRQLARDQARDQARELERETAPATRAISLRELQP